MNGQFDIGDLSPEKLFISLSAVLGLLFALIAESQAHFLIHVIHWQIQTTGALLIILSTHLALFSQSGWLATRPWLKVILSGTLGATIFSPLALMSDTYLAGEALAASFGAELLDELLAITPPMTLAWLTMNSPWLMGYRLKRPSGSSSTSLQNPSGDHEIEPSIDKDSQGEPEFLAQTELSSAKDILYIKSELHYLNVVTCESKQLILHSLAEASSQLDAVGIQGIRCHRGYWVAKSAVDCAQRKGRQAIVKVSNGHEIPVSRANVDHCLRLFESTK